MKRRHDHKLFWPIALVVVGAYFLLFGIPNYQECRDHGFSARYCARSLLR